MLRGSIWLSGFWLKLLLETEASIRASAAAAGVIRIKYSR
jgi:hypothetical protein